MQNLYHQQYLRLTWWSLGMSGVQMWQKLREDVFEIIATLVFRLSQLGRSRGGSSIAVGVI